MPEETPRLYLVTPVVADARDFLPKLEAALDAADVACVLLRLETGETKEAEKIVHAVRAPVQRRGAALLVEGEAELVLRSGADGLHVRGFDLQLEGAIKRLAPDHIVGAGGLMTRDDAMRAGEAGADYVLFGDVDARGGEPSPAWTLERTRWWAEIFNTPCVALAREPSEIGPLAEAGADFVMPGDYVWSDPRGPADAVAEAAARLREGARLARP